MYKLNRFLLSKQDLKFAQSILEPFPLQFHVRVGHNPPAGWQSLGEKLHEQQELNDNVKKSLDIAPQHQPHTLNLMLNQFLLGLCCYGYRLDGQDGQKTKKKKDSKRLNCGNQGQYDPEKLTDTLRCFLSVV